MVHEFIRHNKNCSFEILRTAKSSGWDEQNVYTKVESKKGRIVKLKTSESAIAGYIDTQSTHRLYVAKTKATIDDRLFIPEGPYSGVYLIRYVDQVGSPFMEFAQINLEYIGALQTNDLVIEEPTNE